MIARILVLSLAISGLTANAQSVAVTLNFTGGGSPGNGVALFSGTGTITPFGRANVTIIVDASSMANAGAPAIVSMSFSNIGVGGKFVNMSLPDLQAHTHLPATIDSSQVITGTALFDGGTYQFQSPDGPLQFTLSSPSVESGTFTLFGSGTVTSPILQTIIKQAALAPSVRTAFAQLNGQPPLPPEKFVIGLWNGTQSVQYSTTTSTTSGGNWLSAAPATGTIAPTGNAAVTGTINPTGLDPGVYQGTVTVTGNTTAPSQLQAHAQAFAARDATGFSTNVPVTLVINSTDRLTLSQTGLHFQAGVGVTPAAQSILVFSSGSTPLSFAATASTLTGTNWLSVTPASGAASATSPVPVSIQANTSGLTPGTYSGLIAFAAKDAGNTPQTLQVSLTVLPAAASAPPIFSPSGLVFTATPGASVPVQTLQIVNPTGQNMTLSKQTIFGQSSAWFTDAASATTAISGKPVTLTVTPNIGGLAAGSYTGLIQVSVTETSATYSIPVELVILPGAASGAVCVPTQLLPVFTSLPDHFQTLASLPVPLEAKIVDNCGLPFDAGQASLAFPQGDSSVAMTPLGNGQWAGTWFPHGTASGTASVLLTAYSFTSTLQGATSIQGTLSANKTAPLVNAAGVVSNASFAGGAPLSPGAFVAIFGSNLASSTALAQSLPFSTNMGGAQVFLGGEALPLQYAANGQINAIIPYDAPVNATQQLIVEQGGAYSMPETVLLATAQPAVFTVDQSGTGAGAITVVKSNGDQFQSTPATPAGAGDVLEIFCSGLGAVTPPLLAGSAAPSSPPAQTVNPVTVSIGGQPAQVGFAGLAPGFAGLYQVNVTVPAGITGDTVPVVLTVAGASSPPVTVAIR